MTAYYNEIEPYAAQWLRNLIAAGHIAPGVVDTRSILDVSPDDLAEFTQCHFFAGIGVWSHALRWGGWPDDRPVWTGSCPCQPFSVAGMGGGMDDQRHLWPYWFHLIEQRRPAAIFGEQVEAAIKHGWLDLVQSDLEGIHYAVAATSIPAAGVGAPHIRQRLFFVADASSERCNRVNAHLSGESRQNSFETDWRCEAVQRGRFLSARELAEIPYAGKWVDPGRMADTNGKRRSSDEGTITGIHQGASAVKPSGMPGNVADTTSPRLQRGRTGEACDGQNPARVESERLCHVGGVDDTSSIGWPTGRDNDARHDRQQSDAKGVTDNPGPVNGFWRNADWLLCRDGKWRPVEPGTFPLAHGATARVGRLRAYGNAICAPVAAEFVSAYLECRP